MLSGNAVQFNNQRINESFLVIIDDEISLKQPAKSTVSRSWTRQDGGTSWPIFIRIEYRWKVIWFEDKC